MPETTNASAAKRLPSRERRDLEGLLDWIDTLPGEVTCRRTFPALPARFGEWPEDLDPRLAAALRGRGVDRPYIHQAEAVALARSGTNVCVVTPTASGKTLCYGVPLLDAVLRNPAARGLLLFPTKALAADQLAEFYALTEAAGGDLRVHTYDGDTPPASRAKIRSAGHAVITNPDMLHTGILPHHTKWVRLFENLRYVVVDELHAYRGVFGSHLANVLRRLRRLCAFYGSNPVFIACSATIANPRELAERLFGAPFRLVSENGAARGEKRILFYNPPLVNRALSIRRSSLDEAARIAGEAVASGIRTILFSRSRTNVELLLSRLRGDLRRRGLDPDRVAGYRGGYLPSERRAIERGLREGSLLGVVSTNALELGVDIGSLELAVLHGYPGSVAAAWQQIGRAGRRAGLSAGVLVTSSLPLDQFLAARPDYFFGSSPERARIDPDNPHILMGHLKCSAFELPFREGEPFGGIDPEEALDWLASEGVLHRTEGRWFWQEDSFPAQSLSLRSATSENYVVLDVTDESRPRVIGHVDRRSAPTLIHPEAVYFHAGVPYQVRELDAEGMRALVVRVETDYYTDGDSSFRLQVLDVFGRTESAGWGEALLATCPTIYKKIRIATHENVGYGHIHLPEEQMHTTACWFSPAVDAAWTAWDEERRATALEGTGHLLRIVAPLFLMCDRSDLVVTTRVRDPFLERPAIYLADNVPGGVGLAEGAWGLRERLLESALEALSSCRCEQGCPGCVGASAAGEGSKDAAARFLRTLLRDVREENRAAGEGRGEAEGRTGRGSKGSAGPEDPFDPGAGD